MEFTLQDLKLKIGYSFFSKNNNPTELKPNEITVWNEALKLCIGFIDNRSKGEQQPTVKTTAIEFDLENKILLINRCDYLPEDFFKEFFKGSELIDDCMLKYKNKEYQLVRCEPVGMILQRDIEMYKLVECVGVERRENAKKIEDYLNDLDNLIGTDHFKNESVKDYTFCHKDYTLKQFVIKGREFIRRFLMHEKSVDERRELLIAYQKKLLNGDYNYIHSDELKVDTFLSNL